MLSCITSQCYIARCSHGVILYAHARNQLSTLDTLFGMSVEMSEASVASCCMVRTPWFILSSIWQQPRVCCNALNLTQILHHLFLIVTNLKLGDVLGVGVNRSGLWLSCIKAVNQWLLSIISVRNVQIWWFHFFRSNWPNKSKLTSCSFHMCLRIIIKHIYQPRWSHFPQVVGLAVYSPKVGPQTD